MDGQVGTSSWTPAASARKRPLLPILEWSRGYDREVLADDALAAVIVTLMLIPQGLAYALLAGLPAQAGLYASMAPLLVYALLGSSRVLAVGPVAVVSLMTATAAAPYAAQGAAVHIGAVLALALLSGAMLLAMGVLRLGYLANFLSHPVTSGFVNASAILIAVSQLRPLLGVDVHGETLPRQLQTFAAGLDKLHLLTVAVGASTIAFLLWVRKRLKPLLVARGLSPRPADLLAKAGPVAAIVATTALSASLDWQAHGLRVVGAIPQGLPSLTVPAWDLALWQDLAVPALLIAVVGFVESVSVGQTLAARRRQRVDPDQELLALGGSNLAAAFTGGYPVTGGLSRSIVNFDAGARTPAAGIYTAFGIACAALFLTPLLAHLPQATLAATIVVAVLSLVEFDVFPRTWRYSRTDFAAVAITLAGTLLFGVEQGLVAGLAASLALHLFRTSRPHIAVVGLVPGTEHFRNVLRHRVLTSPRVLGLRVDESLYFANARALEDAVNDAVAVRPSLQHVVLQCSAINMIDASALESLEAIAERLAESHIALHLSEVKGPVMDRLQDTAFLRRQCGKVYLTHYDAMRELAPELVATGHAHPAGEEGEW